MTAGTIVVIGDSHASFFAREDRIVPPHPAGAVASGPFRVHHIGPALAASLVEHESTNRSRAKALEALEGCDPAATAAVILCFGEIDCRFHILRRVGLEAPTDRERVRLSIATTVHRYFSFVLEVRARGFRPVVWGPVASSAADWPPPYPWPTLGTVAERNAVTLLFSELLQARCREWAVPFLSILPRLLDGALATREELFFDGVHLGQAAWPLVREAASHQLPADAAGLFGML